ncbi:MAG: leucine-rich repeat protein [Bacteroidales bacterium]|nr:leucine-rich repeat protein [Bacteroidales bacterium]
MGNIYLGFNVTSYMTSISKIPHIGVIISRHGADFGINDVIDLRGIRFTRAVAGRNYASIFKARATKKLLVSKRTFMEIESHEYFMNDTSGNADLVTAPIDFYLNKVTNSTSFISGYSESITIHSPSFNICSYCFDSNPNLKQLLLDCGEILINGNASYAFARCNQIKELDLSKVVITSSGNYNHFFYNCTSLEKIKLGTVGLYKIGDGSLNFAFAGCTNLRTIEFEANNETFSASISFADSPLDLTTARKVINALA